MWGIEERSVATVVMNHLIGMLRHFIYRKIILWGRGTHSIGIAVNLHTK